MAESNSRKIGNLEIYRGICALLVLIWHYFAHISIDRIEKKMPEFGPYARGVYNMFFELSTYAVLAFFVISGFVITQSILRTTYKDDSFGLYLINRFLRLASLCAAATFVTLPIGYVYRTMNGITEVWSKYGNFDPVVILKSAVGLSSAWNGPGWTLLYEWAFYLLVAVPFLLLRPSIKNLFLACAFTAFVFSCTHASLENPIYLAFVFGIAGLYIHGRIKPLSRPVRIALLLISIITVGVQIYLLPNNYEHMILRSLPLLGIMMFALYEPVYATRFYAALLWLGRISFSLYIWHFPIFLFGLLYFTADDRAGSGPALLWLTFVLVPASFVVAHFSYLYIERYARLERIPYLYNLYLRVTGKQPKSAPPEASAW